VAGSSPAERPPARRRPDISGNALCRVCARLRARMGRAPRRSPRIPRSAPRARTTPGAARQAPRHRVGSQTRSVMPSRWCASGADDACIRETASARAALPPRSSRTTNERADRPRTDCCFALPEQSSQEAGPAQLVLVRGARVGGDERVPVAPGAGSGRPKELSFSQMLGGARYEKRSSALTVSEITPCPDCRRRLHYDSRLRPPFAQPGRDVIRQGDSR
jgi:hypothetical protein